MRSQIIQCSQSFDMLRPFFYNSLNVANELSALPPHSNIALFEQLLPSAALSTHAGSYNNKPLPPAAATFLSQVDWPAAEKGMDLVSEGKANLGDGQEVGQLVSVKGWVSIVVVSAASPKTSSPTASEQHNIPNKKRRRRKTHQQP